MVGSVLCAHSTISLISFAWDMTAEFGIRETAGYLVATGVEGGLSLLVVPLLLLVGASIAVGPWIEGDPATQEQSLAVSALRGDQPYCNMAYQRPKKVSKIIRPSHNRPL